MSKIDETKLLEDISINTINTLVIPDKSVMPSKEYIFQEPFTIKPIRGEIEEKDGKYIIELYDDCKEKDCITKLASSNDLVDIIGDAYKITSSEKTLIKNTLNKILETEFFISMKYIQPIVQAITQNSSTLTSINKLIQESDEYNENIKKYVNNIKYYMILLDILVLLLKRDKICEDTILVLSEKAGTMVKLNELRLQKGSGLLNNKIYNVYKYFKYKNKYLKLKLKFNNH
jgi:hypothetical protein